MKSNGLALKNPLVVPRSGMAITTSLLIADRFAKQHRHVLEAIRNVECSESFSRSNFRPRDYVDDRGKTQPLYEVTRDGFSFLAMGFTGKKAAVFKEQFITAFTRMERALLNQQNISWQEARVEGKRMRRELTDAVSTYVDYAIEQGSKNGSLYYQNITKMIYNALFPGSESAPPPYRDLMDTKHAMFLATAEYIASQVLIEGMHRKLPYKDIYKLTKERISSYASTLPHQRTIAA